MQKGRELPNEGREGASFFWALAKLRPRAKSDSLYAFVQGDPLPHCSLDELNDAPASLVSSGQGFAWLGDPSFLSEADGNPHHGGLPMQERYEQWLGRPWPGPLYFAAGGQFILTGQALKRHTARFYRAMVERMDGDGPWVMERLWEELFRESAAACRVEG